ncbi:MAG TPA: hypothetical protein DCZ94_09965 [Lentisphaeria bacterium]|nr:MAG: hypothetical protein A2X48_08380 [Lentisphaerae bacterium GWF2_49_21]HBC87269.1 hypothetical protein [Lentisphaeria bacterium]
MKRTILGLFVLACLGLCIALYVYADRGDTGDGAAMKTVKNSITDFSRSEIETDKDNALPKVSEEKTADKPILLAADTPAKVEAAKPKELAAQAALAELDMDSWDVFELVFLPGVPSYSLNSKVYGIKVGAPISDGNGIVNGIEVSVFTSMTKEVNGLQTAGFFTDAEEVNGVQFSIVNISDKVGGLQLGILNMSEKSGFQIGVLNYIKDGWIPYFPVINFKF